MVIEELTHRLEEMCRQLNRLPETEAPPPTTLQILGRNRQERDWQQFLAYFLDPEAQHGLDHAVLESVLRGLQQRTDLTFEFSRFELETVDVATEVRVPGGRVDLLIWCDEQWFILCELKIDATESVEQTKTYADTETFHNIALDPTAVGENRRQYLFVTPDGSSAMSDEFAAIEWSWIESRLRAVRESDYGSYPARATSQLDDFVDTIDTELTMTEHDQNEAAKAELYVDYYDEVAEITSAFETEWEELIGEWGRRLATTLDDVRLAEDPDGLSPAPDEDVLLKLPQGEDRDRDRYWLCRQANGDWAWLFPTDWWTDLERDEPIYRNKSPNARVGFLHRPAFDRDAVLEDHELTFYLRNAPSGNEDFYPGFAGRFNDDDEIQAALPDRTERRGVKSNVLEATYEIEVDEHDDLFTAYVAALATAVDEHILSNPSLITRIDDLYEETRKKDVDM